MATKSMKSKTGLQRVQYVTLRVTFNRNVGRREAAKEVADCIHGEFFCGDFSRAETFIVRGAKPAKL